MAINQLQVPVKKEKRDPLDAIVKGLQIANGVFQIPLAIQDFANKRTEGQLKDLELESSEKLGQGQIDTRTQMKGSLIRLPNQPVAIQPPGGVGPVNEPPPAFRPPGSFTAKDAEGNEAAFITPEQLKNFEDQKTNLRKEFTSRDPVQILERAEQHYGNAMNLLNTNSNEAHKMALMSLARLYNPGVSKAGDIAEATDLPQELRKMWARVTGSKGGVIDPKEMPTFRYLADKAMENYLTNAERTIQEFEGHAQKGGFAKEDIGIKDYSKYRAKPKEEKVSGGKAPKAPQFPGAPPVGHKEGGYRFKGGNPADQKNWERIK